MIYLLKVISNENENFLREIEIDAEQTFYRLHEVIQNTCDYDSSQPAIFYQADEEWDKGLEIGQIEGDIDILTDLQNMPVQINKLKQYVKNINDKLIYNFDVFSDRFLFLELKNIIMEKTKNAGVVTLSKGEAPNQLLDNIIEESNFPVGIDQGELEDMNEIYGDIDEII